MLVVFFGAHDSTWQRPSELLPFEQHQQEKEMAAAELIEYKKMPRPQLFRKALQVTLLGMRLSTVHCTVLQAASRINAKGHRSLLSDAVIARTVKAFTCPRDTDQGQHARAEHLLSEYPVFKCSVYSDEGHR